MLYGCTPVDPPVMPLRITLQGIHCDALRIKTMMTGAVARLRTIDNLSFRGGSFERGIRGSGIVTALMTKMMDWCQWIHGRLTMTKSMSVTIEKRFSWVDDSSVSESISRWS
jgi:hypothetical protein